MIKYNRLTGEEHSILRNKKFHEHCRTRHSTRCSISCLKTRIAEFSIIGRTLRLKVKYTFSLPSVGLARKAALTCPRPNGSFRTRSTNCGEYIQCADGRAFKQSCDEGLAYDEKKDQCAWPGDVEGCDAEAYLGFSCPSGSSTGTYKGNDCQHFFVCVNDSPRLNKCPPRRAFSESKETCVPAENVRGCEHLAKKNRKH